MNEVSQSLTALIDKVAETNSEISKEGLVNRALIDALAALLLARGVVSQSDFDTLYLIGNNIEGDDLSERVGARLDAIKRYAKI